MKLLFCTRRFIPLIVGLTIITACAREKRAVVFQTDFGTADGAVSAMKGVAHEAGPNLPLFDLTHEIPPYNIWEAAYRLHQAATYWPKGTVFVSVVDPGVGTSRKSVVLKSKTGHFFVTPDNGTLTLVAEDLGIEEVREIDEAVNRRSNSKESYTFHGRDVYAFTGARLAAGVITFEEVGKALDKEVVRIEYQRANIIGDTIAGNIPVVDVQYGNVWTNISDSLVAKLGVKSGDTVSVVILNNGTEVYRGHAPLVNTFGDVQEGASLAYFNSLMKFSLALNQGSFASEHKVESGPQWAIKVFRRQDR